MFDKAPGRQSPPEVTARFDELFERRYPSTTPESAALVGRIRASAAISRRKRWLISSAAAI
jgi:hypothetical protein